MATGIVIILLAAGASRRMAGTDKLLGRISGQPLVARSAAACLASRAERVLAVVRDQNSAVAAILADLGVETAVNPRADHGMAGSLVAGLEAAGDGAAGYLVALADMPEIAARDINRLIDGFDPALARTVWQATTPDRQPGHPVLFHPSLVPELLCLTGDFGARDLIKQGDVTRITVETGPGAVIDLDTPTDWAAYRKN